MIHLRILRIALNQIIVRGQNDELVSSRGTF
nr:MAG TPA: Folliculin C-terminal domain [Caudoviricetes sp.]